MENRRQRIKIIIPCGVLLFLSFSSLGLSDENKNVTVDQAIGGMDQGRRISSQGGGSSKNIASGNLGSTGNPVIDAHAHPFGMMGNRGYMYSNTSQVNPSQAGNSINPQSERTGSQQISGSVNTGTQIGQNGREQPAGAINANAGTSATGQTNGSAATQEPSGASGSNNPIVAVEANPSSGTPTTAVHTETTTVQAEGNGGVLTGGVETSPTEVTHTVTGSSGTTTQEPSGTSGSNNPIVEVQANPSSGTPTTVHVDTSGQLEDRQVVSAGVTGTGASSSQVEVGSAADVTGQELVHDADITTESITGITGQTVPEQSGTSVGIGETHTESSSSGTTTQEPSGTSGNPIVGVEAGVDQNSGTPNAGVSVDTTGELEDRQILQTDLIAEGISSSGTQVGSASDITGSSAVHGADITTQPVTSITGQTIAGTTEAHTESNNSGTTAQEPSGASNNPIVSVEAGTDQNPGSPNVGVHVDTSGQLEDRQILDAGVTGQATGSSETQIGSASGITGSQAVSGLDVTTQPVVSDIPAPSDLSAEVDTTGQTVGGAADVGAQADVSGVSDSSAVAKDPADGTSAHVGL